MGARRRIALAALALGPALAAAGPKPGERLNFVSCPIVRDTRSVPCWLTEQGGELYYLTIQSDVSAAVQPPMLGHQVIVEGVVSDAPRICGGVVLSPVRLSVMPELDANCRTMLPADDRYTVDFNPRPPGPSGGRLAFAADPTAPPAPPPKVEGPQTLEIYFDFDKSVSFRHPSDLMAVLQRARQIGATRGTVTGMRGAHKLTDGTLLEESPNVGQRRAEEVARLLAGAGLKAPLAVRSADGKAEADGIDDWRSRRVTVVLEP
jgi:outer membrane protein OmpA-like peptidoglycan-associated protein